MYKINIGDYIVDEKTISNNRCLSASIGGIGIESESIPWANTEFNPWDYKYENCEFVLDPIEIDEPEKEHIPTTQELIERIEQNATEAFLAKVESEQMLTDMEIRLLILEAGQ